MGETFYPRLSSKGQVTIPKDIRDELGLGKGDRVKMTLEVLDDE